MTPSWACRGLSVCLLISLVHGPYLVLAEQPTSSAAPSLSTANASAATELNNQGVQEAKAGQWEHGLSLVRQAIQLNPSDLLFPKNLSGMLTDWAGQLEQQGHIDQAMTALQEAVERDPTNGHALVRLGNLYYTTQGQFDKAVELWKQAYGHLTPTEWAAISPRVTQAERDAMIERTFSTLQTDHFAVRFEGSGPGGPIVKELSAALESAYAHLASATKTTPPRLTVIVYSNQDFQRAAGRRDWAVGLYDGRVRLRLDEIGTAPAPQIIAHELAHAFLAHACGPRIPAWIQEGFAQSQEPEAPLTDEQQRLREQIVARNSWVPLKWLDRHFQQPTDMIDLERAYMQARVIMMALISRRGMGPVLDFVTRVGKGTPVASAFDQAMAPLQWARVDQGILE